MRKKINSNILNQIGCEFSKIKSPKEIKNNKKEIQKIINFCKRHNVPLGEKRKLFCKKCKNYFFPGKNCSIKIKKGKKIIRCFACSFVSRYSLNKKI